MAQIPEHLDDVGPGWMAILQILHSRLVEAKPDYQVAQVKEKFGELRVYLADETFRTMGLVEEATRESLRTCETCGQPGELRTNRGWHKTMCNEHAGGNIV